MNKERITELNRHDPSVESVISRLDRHQGKITHITAIIEWDDGSSDVVYDSKDMQLLCYESVILNKYVGDLVYCLSDDE